MLPRIAMDYEEGLTKASMSALLELSLTLKSYRESIVLVGGWVPYLLIQQYGKKEFKHVGSIDIDLAIDPDSIDVEKYATMIELIEGRGYSNRLSKDGQNIPFSYCKDIVSPWDSKKYSIHIDFLTTETEERAGHRHRRVQHDLPARMAAGCELAFTNKMWKTIDGELPDGGITRTEISMLDIPGCLGMKGVVLGERFKEKDAYDIYSVIGYCLDNPGEIAKRVKPHLSDPTMKAGIDIIKEKFRDIRAEGPAWVGYFLHPEDQDMKERAIARAYVKLKEFIEALDGNQY